MIDYLDRISSLRNLRRDNLAGQVATLLILIITIMLIFVLVVANVGQVSNYATNLSIAADKASLHLASLLGTKSYQFSKSLLDSCNRPVACCVKTGFLALFLSIIVAIIAIIVCIICPPLGIPVIAGGFVTGYGAVAIIVAGAIGGAVGGAIGGAIAGTGALQGAIQGLMIGAAIGGGFALGGMGAFGLGLGGIVTPFGLSAPIYMGALVGALLGATIAITCNVYTAWARDQMLGDAIGAAVKAMNGLGDEVVRRRENLFYQTFLDTIDDPTKTRSDLCIDCDGNGTQECGGDPCDSDGDGNTAELVPNFQFCWDRRIDWIKKNNSVSQSQQMDEIHNFLKGATSAVGIFLSAISQFYPHKGREGGEGILGLFSALENAGYPISFWYPGPSQELIDAWLNWDPFSCGSCTAAANPCGESAGAPSCPACEPPDPPQGWDEVDYTFLELRDFAAEVADLREQADASLAFTWRVWLKWFYNPATDTNNFFTCNPSGYDYYNILCSMVYGEASGDPGIPNRVGFLVWLQEVENIRLNLPQCNYGCAGQTCTTWCSDNYGAPYCCGWAATCNPAATPCYDCILSSVDPNTGRLNPPCRWHPNNPEFATTDTDFDDEFKEFSDAVKNFIQPLNSFRQAAKDFYLRVSGLSTPVDPSSPMACGLSGGNPAVYEWTDSRGQHYIKITIAPYVEPEVVKTKSGGWFKGKKCIVLVNWQKPVNVEIERSDEQSTESVGILGQWNPFHHGIVKRSSTAEYIGLASPDEAGQPNGCVRVISRK
jgi:hypothetical protein